ncbi:MAG TPA: bifunctional glutamate N-acetyltransferase/amino-acid acetyltransferase ArgJ [Acidimicrobiales bacterium]|nr:bifunctional glutamate N-acetyltransferase/amino-acid acetyltransferase ArgJ [Acidimicrobiales bacterium]
MSVTAARGFVAAGGAVGIKAGGAPDLAVVATSDGRAVPAAGVFTDNLAAAAPVRVSREHLGRSAGLAAAVVLTSGNANAATGPSGLRAAERLCALVASGVGAGPHEVLVCQTGLIGVQFPTEVLGAVSPVVAARAPGVEAGRAAAEAIMTTDTLRKEAVAHVGASRARSVVGGMAKGAAMLAPRMATMLAVLTTDAQASPGLLHAVLRDAVDASFNRITVDGCTSTNDTVLLLASGEAGPVPGIRLGEAVAEVCGSLAEQMVADAEGATKMARVTVSGAASDGEAHAAARKVATSLLVKCSLNGADPYWGRVVSELGSSGVAFDLERTFVSYGGIVVCARGEAALHDRAAVAAHMAGRLVEITCDLGMGIGEGAVLTTDLGHGYIDENRTTS